MPFWTKENGGQESGISKGKTIYTQMRKSECVVNKFLLGHPETVVHRGKFNKQALLDFSVCNR